MKLFLCGGGLVRLSSTKRSYRKLKTDGVLRLYLSHERMTQPLDLKRRVLLGGNVNPHSNRAF